MGSFCCKDGHATDPAQPTSSSEKGAAEPDRAIAFSGGGFLSFAAASGLTVGLLDALGKNRNEEAPTLDALLQRFGVVSAVSGGSWYTAELAYSDRLPALINLMVADIGNAGALFNTDWTSRLLNGGKPVPTEPLSFTELRAALLEAVELPLIGGIPVGELLELIASLSRRHGDSEGITWGEFAELLLESTAGLSAKTTVGSAPNSCVHGKLWLVGTSIVTPTGGNGAVSLTHHLPSLSDPQMATLAYNIKSVKTSSVYRVPKFTPAAFSWKFGRDQAEGAPRQFSIIEDVIEYHGSPDFEAISQPLSDVYSAAISNHAGKLPVGQVVAASSAFAGQLILNPALQVLTSNQKLDLDVWISSATEGSTFSVARQVLTATKNGFVIKESVDHVAHHALHTIIDGGFTDGTGIAHSVAAGSNSVVSVQIALDWMNALFEGGGDGNGCGPIFRESTDSIQVQLRNFTYLDVPTGNSKHLSRIGFGTVSAHTVDNMFWGIKANRLIKIKIIIVESDAGIGGTSDFYNYGALVGNIAATMAAECNAPKVKSLLRDFFL